MIRQQINLHQPIFRKQRALFSAAIVLRICAIWVLALGGYYAAAVWRDQQQAREIEALTRQRDQAQARLADVRWHSVRCDALLTSGDLGDTVGFAPQIYSLAERRVAGVWLTHIGISAGGRRLDLRGDAVREDLLPEYLERLAHEPGMRSGFGGTHFGSVLIQRATDGAGIHFELDTDGNGARAGRP